MKIFKGKYLMVIISMCGLAAASLGLMVNVAGVFFTPVSADLGIGKASVSLTLTISNLAFAVGGILSPKLIRSGNFKKMLLLFAIIFSGATMLLSLAPGLWALYLLNAVRGLAAGIIGMVLLTIVINNWFYESTSLATSIAMAFSGIAGAIFSPVLSSIITSAGWRTGYLAAGILIFLFELPALLLPIGFMPRDIEAQPFGTKKETADPAESSSSVQRFPMMIMILLCAYGILVSYLASYPPHFPSLADGYGLPTAIGSMMLSVCMVANSGGKILFGFLSDRLGTKKTIPLFGIAITVGAVLLVLLRIPAAMFVGAFLFGLCYAMNIGAISATRELAGRQKYNEVYPIINMTATLANAFGSSLVGVMYDASGSYTGALSLAIGLSVLTIVLILAAYGYHRKLSA